MSSRIPPLLEPYLALPQETSLILLTSVLGASSNWLILRFLHSALIGPDPAPTIQEDDAKVVLVSFMRDFAFWRENSKRLGLDLEKLATRKRFCFVDGLTGLFLPKTSTVRTGKSVLNSLDLAAVSREIQRSIQSLKDAQGGGNVFLLIDQLDLLLAAGGDQIGAVKLGEMLVGLQEEVHSAILSLSADYPLVSASQTPLEKDHAALVLNLSHEADFVLSLRLLDTGTARDVSGVLRITVKDSIGQIGPDIQRRIEEKELLYFVGGDGGVKVFERGQ
ncbi:hypothetical protein N431DRAFT_559749 [Stipitochalara longipes BDJ]|nr:hypothetical protein N431DRAFT_559749 [Stipitochalara longipes BDJ]